MAGRGGYSSTVFQSKVCSFDESQQSIQGMFFIELLCFR